MGLAILGAGHCSPLNWGTSSMPQAKPMTKCRTHSLEIETTAAMDPFLAADRQEFAADA
jgi:hypothetical protein